MSEANTSDRISLTVEELEDLIEGTMPTPAEVLSQVGKSMASSKCNPSTAAVGCIEKCSPCIAGFKVCVRCCAWPPGRKVKVRRC